jgi:hypothetical protein
MTRLDLTSAIRSRICNLDANTVLTDEQVHELTQGFADFIDKGTEKYIRGQKEHGGSLHQRNCVAELRNELLDMHHYLTAVENSQNSKEHKPHAKGQ